MPLTERSPIIFGSVADDATFEMQAGYLTGQVPASEVKKAVSPVTQTVRNRFSADHTGWRVGDLVEQTGDSTPEAGTVTINADLPNDGIDYYLGIKLTDTATGGHGSLVIYNVYFGSARTAPIPAATVASDFALLIVDCQFATATATNNVISVDNTNPGAVAAGYALQSNGTMALVHATLVITNVGSDGIAPGSFIVSDLDELGDVSGYQGLGMSQILSGFGAPTAGLGRTGNGYLDKNSGNFYERNEYSWDLVSNLTGPPGNSGRSGLTAAQISQVALLRFWQSSQSVAVGNGPASVCFDGTNVWTSNFSNNNVTKVLASTGAIVGTYTVGTHPQGICFDGTNIWVANSFTNNVTKLLASSGALVGTYAVSGGPYGICYDGTNIWVTNTATTTVTKLVASTGALVGTYSTGSIASNPRRVCFDGTNIWVTRYSGNVSKLLASNGSLIGTYPVGSAPEGVCFDGTNIWVANSGVFTVTKLLASTGALIGTYPVSSVYTPLHLCFDGMYIWVATGGSYVKLLANTGALLQTYSTTGSQQPLSGICFDGSNIWVTGFTLPGTLIKQANV